MYTFFLRAAGWLACIPFVPIQLQAQDPPCDHVLQGQVIDEHDRTPLSFAEVRVVGTEQGVVSDPDGYFRLDQLCAGVLRLRVTHLGCEAVERSITVPRDQVLVIELEHHAHELREMEVIRARPDEQVGQPHATVAAEEMARNSGADLAKLLVRIPGVSVFSSGPTIAKPTINGLSGNRVVIMNQGVRQEDQQWGSEHAPNLDPFSSDRITVVRGASGVQYGSDAIGGVIITRPAELPRTGPVSGAVHGSGSYNGRGGSVGGRLQGVLKGDPRFAWRVQGSGRYLGDAEAPRYVLSNTGVREGGRSVAVGYRGQRWSSVLFYSRFERELGILRAAHVGNLTDLRNALASGVPWYVAEHTYAIDAPRQTVVHHLAKAELTRVISDRSRLVINYGGQLDQRREYDLRRAGRSSVPALALDLRTHTVDLELKHWIGERVHGKLGVNGLLQENESMPGTGVRPLIPNYRRELLGLFWVEHMPVSERLELEAGVRVEHARLDVARFDANGILRTPIHRFGNGAFSAGLAWVIRDGLTGRFNVGSAYRPPHVSELYSEGLHHGAAAIELGDATLRSERSLNATADLEGIWFNGRLTAQLSLRSDRMDGYIHLRPEGARLTIRGAFPVYHYTAVDATLNSADAMVRSALSGQWSVQLRASTVRARDRTTDQWLVQMPADRVTAELTHVVPARERWAEFSCTMSLAHTARQRRIPHGIELAAAPSGYQLIGLSGEGGKAIKGNMVRFGVEVTNLFNVRYREYMDRFRYYADARGTDVRIWIAYTFGGHGKNGYAVAGGPTAMKTRMTT